MVSSTEAMGPHNEQANEDTKLEPVYAYGESKVAVEKFLAQFQKKNSDFKYTILRPTGIFGPHEIATKYQLMLSINFGLFFFTPKNTGISQWIHVDDVVSAIIAAIESEKRNEIYIICTDDWMSYEHAICTLCLHFGRIQPLFRLPVSLIAIIVKLTKVVLNIPFSSPFLFEEKTVLQMNYNRWYTNAKAKKQLGWSPHYTMREGYYNTVQWYLNNGFKKWIISPVAILGLLLSVLLFLTLF